MRNNEINVEIAGICTLLNFNDTNADLINLVKEEYREFLSRNKPKVIIDVYILPNLKIKQVNEADVNNLSLYFKDNIVKMHFSNFVGIIDFKKMRGQLIANPANLSVFVQNYMRVLYSSLILKENGFFVHASAVSKDNKGYVFLGHSGSGKTTAAKLSKDYDVLNDDLTLLKKNKGSYYAYGIPFWGELGRNHYNPDNKIIRARILPNINKSIKIKGFFKLIKDKKTFLKKISLPEAAAYLVSGASYNKNNKERFKRILHISYEMAKKIPSYELHFQENKSFWGLIDNAR